jgi:hypothetical protein
MPVTKSDPAHAVHRGALLRLLAAAALAGGSGGLAQNVPDFERQPVSYSATAPRDAVARLQQRIASGELAFSGGEKEVLKALLRELRVPVESQTLVFSRTSLQRGRIRPQRPRALYFSESAYVGWVPGGLIEITTIDPQLGPVFYSFDLPAGPDERPKIVRDSDCLRCHGGTFVREIPAVFARSVFPAASGEPLLRFGTQVVDDQTPFAERWGGWYVTGYHGPENHRGNTLGAEVDGQLVFEPATKRPDELSAFFNVSDYLAATSDVVALMVFEHQMAMQNSLTRAAFAARKMLAYQHSLQATFKEPLTDEPAYDSVKSVFASSVQDVVDRLLFRGEAPLPEGVSGGEAFRHGFARDAVRSRAGHALKDLLLRERVFAHRCSYLIYSDFFLALPEPLKGRILDRLRVALDRGEPDARYSYLGDEEKQRIHDILVETHPDVQRRWAEAGAPAPAGPATAPAGAPRAGQ